MEQVSALVVDEFYFYGSPIDLFNQRFDRALFSRIA